MTTTETDNNNKITEHNCEDCGKPMNVPNSIKLCNWCYNKKWGEIDHMAGKISDEDYYGF